MENGLPVARLIGALICCGLILSAAVGLADDQPQAPPVISDSSKTAPTADDSLGAAIDGRRPIEEEFGLVGKRPLAKTLGDMLWFEGGVLSFQHGPEGQPEIFVKSILLGGQGIIIDGLPFFQQGLYVPQRSGPDLNTVMFENLAEIELTRLNHLDLSTEGTVLSLKTPAWPPAANPSSITVARGPYGYERTAWRFTKNFSRRLAATFCAGFKKSKSFYTSGADYDGFGVSGSLVGDFRRIGAFRYGFYENKSDQGILQFDRMVPPSKRLKRDIIRHQFRLEKELKKGLTLFSDLLYQKNEAKADGLYLSPAARPRDRLILAAAGTDIVGNRNKLRIAVAYRDLNQTDQAADTKILRQYALLVCDSLPVSTFDEIRVAFRWRGRNPGRSAGSASFGYEKKKEDFRLGIHGGYHDSDPDPYAAYFGAPAFGVNYSGLIEINEYRVETIPSMPLKTTAYALVFGGWSPHKSLKSDLSVSFERVSGDSYWRLIDSSGIWTAEPTSIDYRRATITLSLGTAIGGFFNSRAGMTSFIYFPRKTEWGEKHSPSLIGFGESEAIWKGALRDVDLSAQIQARYCGRRHYYGFVDSSYGPFAVVDCALGIRYASFDFHVIGSNVFDFIIGNEYKLWGEYNMPPGTIWWVFNWKFVN